MSASEEPSFTVELHGNDFMLHTGVASHRLEDEVVQKITKCKGEYIPSSKGFVIPHGELCNLLDECFDYFSEESLLSIASMVENTAVDQSTKERVREKSASKSKAPKKKKDEAKLDVIREDDKPSKSKTRDLEEKLIALEKEREAGRRAVRDDDRRAVRDDDRRVRDDDRRAVRDDDRRVREEEKRRQERLGSLQEQSRFKASPPRFRAPEPLFPSHASSRLKKSVNFDSQNDGLRREVMDMMSSLRTSVSDIKVNMTRLEQLISRNF